MASAFVSTFYLVILADMTKPRRTTSISLTPDEEPILRAAMQRDGMHDFGPWMKSVCHRYATGQLVPAQPRDEEFIRQMVELVRRITPDQIDTLNKAKPVGDNLVSDNPTPDETADP